MAVVAVMASAGYSELFFRHPDPVAAPWWGICRRFLRPEPGVHGTRAGELASPGARPCCNVRGLGASRFAPDGIREKATHHLDGESDLSSVARLLTWCPGP